MIRHVSKQKQILLNILPDELMLNDFFFQINFSKKTQTIMTVTAVKIGRGTTLRGTLSALPRHPLTGVSEKWAPLSEVGENVCLAPRNAIYVKQIPRPVYFIFFLQFCSFLSLPFETEKFSGSKRSETFHIKKWSGKNSHVSPKPTGLATASNGLFTQPFCMFFTSFHWQKMASVVGIPRSGLGLDAFSWLWPDKNQPTQPEALAM